MKFITLTNLLIAVNVLAYGWQTATGGLSRDHGYLTPQSVLQYGEWWRIFTAAFLHVNEAHIGLNMLALYSLGREVEWIFGKVRFALIYVVAIAGSGLAVIYFADYRTSTLGASGAIYGLFGAILAVGVRLGKPGRAVIMSVVPVLVLNLAFTFTIPGISAPGHVGGLITGFLATLVIFMGARQRERAYAFAMTLAPAGPTAPAVTTVEPDPDVETIEHPPDAGPHEEADAPPLHVRDPRE